MENRIIKYETIDNNNASVQKSINYCKVHKERNQPEVIVNNVEIDKTGKHPFKQIDYETIEYVIKDLHEGSALDLWFYISKNMTGYHMLLGASIVKAETGLGKTAYDIAMKTLKEKNYLVQVDGSKTIFNFYQYPKK